MEVLKTKNVENIIWRKTSEFNWLIMHKFKTKSDKEWKGNYVSCKFHMEYKVPRKNITKIQTSGKEIGKKYLTSNSTFLYKDWMFQ